MSEVNSSKAYKLVNSYFDKAQELEKLQRSMVELRDELSSKEHELSELGKELSESPSIAPVIGESGIRALDNRILMFDDEGELVIIDHTKAAPIWNLKDGE